MISAPSAASAHSPTAAATDPLQRLREATSSLHARLDTGLPIAREGAGPVDYLRHLALLRGWVDLLQRSGADLPRLEEERGALDAELAEAQDLLGQRAPRIDLAAARDPLFQAEGSDWGLSYVLEGSRLGGQVLHKRLGPAMAPLALNYLRGSGADTGPRWKRFIAELRTALHSDARLDAAAAAARRAFELLLLCHEALSATQAMPASAVRTHQD
ncbi:biliverdin-producing heme oxygenase [uncultured Pseudacidovorax sp.]|uniref:biliverdin-producing heme oxygenase n=1 Tax=uncultured Pseudacidovorax sp. TaxID=679313 RepID=UPI0025E187E2|nr:biliverdin-producing heme oxygenase [uncultured Pseudacidovorax sp.]